MLKKKKKIISVFEWKLLAKVKMWKIKRKNYSEKNRSYCMWMLCNSDLNPFYLYFLLNLNQLSNSKGHVIFWLFCIESRKSNLPGHNINSLFRITIRLKAQTKHWYFFLESRLICLKEAQLFLIQYVFWGQQTYYEKLNCIRVRINIHDG